MNRLKKLLLPVLTVIGVLSTPLVIMLTCYFFFRERVPEIRSRYVSDHNSVSIFGRFLLDIINPDSSAAANWVLALFAFLTLLVTSVAAFQLVLLQDQANFERERTEREAFRLLISPLMQSTKRFLRNPEVQAILKSLPSKMDTMKGNSVKRSILLLDQVRQDILIIGQKNKMPLLNNTSLSLDHIESLINEYEYLSKLINDERLKSKFATELSQENFVSVFNAAEPLIILRQNGSPKYAYNFTKYCKKLSLDQSLSMNSSPEAM